MTQLIAANWKMNGSPDWDAKVGQLTALVPDASCELLICPPHLLLDRLAKAASGTPVKIGGQDCSEHDAGPHTGETEAALLAGLGATYVILGHSERRAAGETDAVIKAKADKAIAAGLRPIICVGESLSQRESGKAERVVTDQLSSCVPANGDFDIAYEPIWAIGTGKTATVQDIADMHASIRSHVGAGPRILYGGSVKPGNAADILSTAEVGGALVGGASLDIADFSEIALAAH
jgi:triosephosphate isomerase